MAHQLSVEIQTGGLCRILMKNIKPIVQKILSTLLSLEHHSIHKSLGLFETNQTIMSSAYKGLQS